MKLLGFEVRSPIRRAKDVVVSDRASWWTRIGGLVREPFTGAWQRNIECDTGPKLFANSVVYACISRIANDGAKMPPLLKRKVGNIWEVVQEASPFWPVLRKPNPYQTRIQFFVCWYLSLLSTGNTYVLKERDGRNVVVGLHILNSRQVEIHMTDRGEVFYKLRFDKDYIFNGVLREIAVPASEIIHDLINPLFHPLCGVPPLYAAAMAATQAGRIQTETARFFENGGRPSGLLITPNDVAEEDAKRWKEEWQTNFSGANRGNVAVMSGGLKYEMITQTNDDAQMIELLKWTAEDIARPFGVPLYKINAGPVPVSNNVEALNAQYYSDTLQSRIEAIEVLLDEGLSLPADLCVEFDLDVPLRMDTATQVDVLDKEVKAGIASPDEAREKRGRKPVTGGETPYLQQQNYSLAALAKRDASPDPFGTAKPPPPPPAPPPAAAPDPEAEKAAAFYAREMIRRASLSALGLDK